MSKAVRKVFGIIALVISGFFFFEVNLMAFVNQPVWPIKTVIIAVFGIPNNEWGEEVKAVVELLPDKRTDDLDDVRAELLEFLQGRVARYKLPKSIDFMEALPRDPNGKLYKRRLRDPYWAGQQRAI